MKKHGGKKNQSPETKGTPMGQFIYKKTFFGRNLIVQALYFGALRYWLFSLHLPPKQLNIIQNDAQILLWHKKPHAFFSEEPDDSRFRRWVNQNTALGPRTKGGLNVMDWSSHVKAFMTNWIIRYIYPDNSSWKNLLDHFILDNHYNQEKFPEGRMILLCNISPYQYS